MPRLELTLFGGMQARIGDMPVAFPRRKAAGLLAYLALQAEQVHPRDKLAALLWGEVPDERARHSLRQTLLTLRHALGGHCLIETSEGIALAREGLDLDVARFERLARDGTPAALERAADLYRGDLLEGIPVDEGPFEEWLRHERERLRERALEVLTRLLAHEDGSGATTRAVQTGIRLLALDPTQETVHRSLMRLYARDGRRGAALRQYQACVDVLERELGAGPEPDTKRLYQELLKASPAGPPATARAGARSGTEPQGAIAEPAPAGPSLVGRDSEIATLRSALEAAWQGQGRVVLVGGDVGVGKTRLVETLGDEAAGADGHLLIGRAHENEQVLPLGPWVDAFRTRHVVAALQQLDPPWRMELGRLFPELGTPPPARRAAEDYARLFEAVARAIDHLALARPLLLVLEDLHWADELTLRMLTFLARRVSEWPVLVAVTYRLDEMAGSELLRRCVAQVARMPGSVSLTLAPLSQADTGTLVRRLARTGTEAHALDRLGERIWQVSEGNAFMIVEMVRAFDAVPPAGPGQVLGTPPSVRELVAARLDRLGERARRLAAVASVIGRAFEFALLQRAAGSSDAEVAEGVEELVARRVLRTVGERIDFTHDRIREVAYDRLLPPYRRRLHRTVAEALDALHAADPDPHALALGRHFLAGEAWDRAFEPLRRAASWAAARGAHREAIASDELALDALRRLPPDRARIEQTIDLRFDLRHSCVPIGDHACILAHMADAEAAARAIGDRRRLGWALAYRANAHYLAGDCAAARRAGEDALAMAVDLDDPMLQEWANVYLAQVYHWLGQYRAGVERLRENISRLEPSLLGQGVQPKQFVTTRMMIAWCLAELGEFDDARAHAGEAVAAARARDSAYWLVHAYCGLAVADIRRGAPGEAIPAAARALDVCQGRDYDVLWGFPATLLGAAYALAGRPAEAIPLLEEVANLGHHQTPVLVFLAQAYLDADRAEDADRAVTLALEQAERGAERGWEAWGRFVLGDIYARDARADAAGAYRSALAIAESLGMRPLVAHCHRALASAYRSTAPADAAVHGRTAVAMYQDLGMVHSTVR